MEMIPHNRWVNRPEYEAAALRVLRSGHVAQGPEVEAFERELAARFRPGGAAAVVSSGTAALYLALATLTRDGNRTHRPFPYPWSLPTYACSALLNALEMVNVLDEWYKAPEPIDVDAITFNAPADVTVHTYGVPCRTVGAGSPWIEDFTHAPGATLDGRPCGSLGDLSVISLGATKPLGVGAGGAVLGPAEAIREIRDHRDYDQSKSDRAFNWQLGDVYAAIGRERLGRLDQENDERWRIQREYLASTRREITLQEARAGSRRVHYRYVIRVADWRRAQAHFATHGVETINPLLPEELLHRRLGLNREQFPNAEAIAASTLSLPIWPGMTEEQVSRVADALSKLEA